MPKNTATTLPPGAVGRDRDRDVAADQDQQDSPDQVVDVRAADRDVARPPAHLRPDRAGAGADEAEGEQEGYEEEKVRLAPGVDDSVLMGAADAGRWHGANNGRRKALDARRNSHRECRERSRSSSAYRARRRRDRRPCPARLSLSGPPATAEPVVRRRRRSGCRRRAHRSGGPDRRRPPSSPTPVTLEQICDGSAHQAVAARSPLERPDCRRSRLRSSPEARVGIDGVAAAARGPRRSPRCSRRAAHLLRGRLTGLGVVEAAGRAAAVGIAQALRRRQHQPPVGPVKRLIRLSMPAMVVQGQHVHRAAVVAPRPWIDPRPKRPRHGRAEARRGGDRSDSGERRELRRTFSSSPSFIRLPRNPVNPVKSALRGPARPCRCCAARR